MVRKVKPERVTELREAHEQRELRGRHFVAQLDAEHAQKVAQALAEAVVAREQQGQSPQVRENLATAARQNRFREALARTETPEQAGIEAWRERAWREQCVNIDLTQADVDPQARQVLTSWFGPDAQVIPVTELPGQQQLREASEAQAKYIREVRAAQEQQAAPEASTSSTSSTGQAGHVVHVGLSASQCYERGSLIQLKGIPTNKSFFDAKGDKSWQSFAQVIDEPGLTVYRLIQKAWPRLGKTFIMLLVQVRPKVVFC